MNFNADNLFRTSNGFFLAILEDDIVVPQTLHDAVLRIKNITSDDSILVEMYCENNPDCRESIMFWAGFEEEKFWFYWDWACDSDDWMNKLKSYRNFKCFDWWWDEDYGMKRECCSLSTADIDYALRFLTDYFMFLNPKVKTEDILVDVRLNPEPSFDECILIIPDVHGRRFWVEAVEKYPDIPTIFLGDYHDPYPSENISEDDSLANFREIIDYANSHENVQLLLGNHDLHYLCNFGEGCRIDYENSAEIHSLLFENISRMKIADLRTVGGKTVLFSHAPILTDWIKSVGLSENPEEIVFRLNSLLDSIIMDPLETDKMLGHTSEWRGGYDPVGSPIWADMNEITDNLIPAVDYCVFGHTKIPKAVRTDRWANLDCRKAFLLFSGLKPIQI